VHVGPKCGAEVRDRLVTMQNLPKETQPSFEFFCIHSDF